MTVGAARWVVTGAGGVAVAGFGRVVAGRFGGGASRLAREDVVAGGVVDVVGVAPSAGRGAGPAGSAMDAATAPVASSALVDTTAVTAPTVRVALWRRDAEYRTGDPTASRVVDRGPAGEVSHSRGAQR